MQKGWQSQGEHPGTNSGSVWSIWWWHHDQPRMDHTAYSGHQRQQQVSSCEILCGDQGGARILISHATATWLGLVKVLCPNKVPRIKRQVVSVSKKAREPLDSSNSNCLSGPEHPPKVKYFYNNDITTPQHPPKVKYTGMVTVNEQQHERPTSRPRSHGRKHHRGKPAHWEEEGQVANRSVEFQSF